MSEAAAKHNAELQTVSGEKNALAVRLQEYERNASTVLGNARQQERLATEAELQKEMADMRGRIRELEADHKLLEDQKEIEIARVKTAMESALSSEKRKLEDRDRLVKDYLAEIGRVRERNEVLAAEMAKVAVSVESFPACFFGLPCLILNSISFSMLLRNCFSVKNPPCSLDPAVEDGI
ncbi:MAG: hypothetical protein QOD84_1936 [Acidobacteriaceae bacterium]